MGPGAGVCGPRKSNTPISLILKANQLTTNQIDWFLYETDYGLEWVEKWIKFWRNTWWNFCFLVKLLKHLTIPANITCSTIKTTETLGEGVKICLKLTIKILERRQWRSSGVFNVKFEPILRLLLVFLLLTFEHIFVCWNGTIIAASLKIIF